MKILVFHGKHRDTYYDASTPEKEARACLQELNERHDTGWFFPPSLEEPSATDAALMALTDEQLAQLPEETRNTLIQQREQAARRDRGRRRRYEEDREWWDSLQRLLKLDFSEAASVVWKTDRQDRPIYLATRLVTDHEDYEYEGFERVNVREA